MNTSQELSSGDLGRTRAYVKSVAMKYVRNDQDAEDVAQDALLLAHRYRASFRGQNPQATRKKLGTDQNNVKAESEHQSVMLCSA